MLDRNCSTVGKVLLVLFVLLLGANSALAYVGPGVDVNFIGQFMALAWMVLAAFSTILLWPVYALIRKIRGKKKAATASPLEATPQESPAVSPPELEMRSTNIQRGAAPEEARAASHTEP